MKMMTNLKKVYERPYVEMIPLGDGLMQTPGADLPSVSGVAPGDGTVITPGTGPGPGHDLAKEFSFHNEVGYDNGWGDDWDLWDK